MFPIVLSLSAKFDIASAVFTKMCRFPILACTVSSSFSFTSDKSRMEPYANFSKLPCVLCECVLPEQVIAIVLASLTEYSPAPPSSCSSYEKFKGLFALNTSKIRKNYSSFQNVDYMVMNHNAINITT